MTQSHGSSLRMGGLPEGIFRDDQISHAIAFGWFSFFASRCQVTASCWTTMSSFNPGSHTRQKSILERVLFEATVNYRSAPGKTFSGLCSDLSAGGLYLRTKFPLEKNDILEISFSLPNSGEKSEIFCKARVAWTNFEAERRKPDYPSGVGLEFLNLPPDEKDRLTAFIETYDEHKKMNVLCAWCGCCLGTRKGPFGVTSHGICQQCRLKLADQK